MPMEQHNVYNEERNIARNSHSNIRIITHLFLSFDSILRNLRWACKDDESFFSIYNEGSFKRLKNVFGWLVLANIHHFHEKSRTFFPIIKIALNPVELFPIDVNVNVCVRMCRVRNLNQNDREILKYRLKINSTNCVDWFRCEIAWMCFCFLGFSFGLKMVTKKRFWNTWIIIRYYWTFFGIYSNFLFRTFTYNSLKTSFTDGWSEFSN